MRPETLNTEFGRTIANKTAKVLDENLSAFAHRFPVSGRVVHAVAVEVGGVIALAERLEEQGLWPQVEQWMVTSKPTTLGAEAIHSMLGAPLIERTAGYLGIPRESVEIQLALGIPKFFATLAADEDDGLGLGYGAKKKAKTRSGRARHSDLKRSDITPP